MTEPKKSQKKGKSILGLFLLLLLFSIFFIVVYSAMLEGNHERRVIVPEALDAPYQPYRPSMNANTGRMMPIDSMMRDLYVVQREINQGSHQLYLFFDTFTHRPAPLDLNNMDLKNPKDAQWYNIGIYGIMLLLVVLPTILMFVLKKGARKKVLRYLNIIGDKDKYEPSRMKRFLDFIKQNKMMIVIIVFMLAILLSMVNLSIPLDKEYEYRADPFFVFVCFSSIAVAIVSIKYVLKRSKNIKLGGDTTLAGKHAFSETLIWAALGAWAMGFLCYFIGMYSLGTQKSVLASIVRPALESGKMFVLSDNVKEISFTLRNNGAFMGFYTLCKLMFLLISSFALVSLAWSRINSYWSIWDSSRGPGELYVFFGINDNSKILAHDIAMKLKEKYHREPGEKRRRDYTIVLVENRNSPVEGMGNGMSISSLVGMFNFRKDAYAEVFEVSPDALLVISNSAIGCRECSEQINKTIERFKNRRDTYVDDKQREAQKREDMKQRYELFNTLGLKNLSKMIKNAKNCHFFFLDDDDRSNIDSTDNLRKMMYIVHDIKGEATIYCLARNNAFSKLLDTPLRDILPRDEKRVDKIKVKILDLSVMATQSLFLDPDNHPINFVECDPATATVKSRFESLVIGFGRGGRDTVSYLYEFGAFLDYNCMAGSGKPQKMTRSPFQCTILDKDINMIKPRYMAKIPAVRDACNNGNAEDPLLRFEQAALNSERFVELVDEKLRNLDMNFIVISIGNDKKNMGALTYVIDQAMRVRNGNLGKLRIFVRNYDPNYESTMKEQADHFNQLLGNDHFITIFGNRLKLLTYDMVVEDKIDTAARQFHRTYNELGDRLTMDWDKRHDRGRGIRYDGNSEDPVYSSVTWQEQNLVMRQETQDIHNGMLIDSKLRLIGLVRKGTAEDKQLLPVIDQLKEAIAFKNHGCQIEFTSSEVHGYDVPLIYLNLARNEHLRRIALLEMLGYEGAKGGAEAQFDDAGRVHPCLVDWDNLDEVSDKYNQRYPDRPIDFKALNYLFIKSTFEVAHEEIQGT